MLYLGTPSGPEVRAAMTERADVLGCMTTPDQGNDLPPGCRLGADNGKFGKSWKGADHWWAWLTKTVTRYGADRFVFAVAPDVPFDPHATLAESLPWLPKIRALGVPAAFVAQNGVTPELVPWDLIDVLFLGGGPECLPCGYVRPPDDRDTKTCPECGAKLTEWKESAAAGRLVAEALSRGLKGHIGRVSSWRRILIGVLFGCSTADGTYLRFGPDKNLRRLLDWLDEVDHGILREAS